MDNLTALSVRQLAELLNINRYTAYHKARNHQIPGMFRVGPTGSIRFVEKIILEWINSQVHQNNYATQKDKGQEKSE